jgi:hypothetical protein
MLSCLSAKVFAETANLCCQLFLNYCRVPAVEERKHEYKYRTDSFNPFVAPLKKVELDLRLYHRISRL